MKQNIIYRIKATGYHLYNSRYDEIKKLNVDFIKLCKCTYHFKIKHTYKRNLIIL